MPDVASLRRLEMRLQREIESRPSFWWGFAPAGSRPGFQRQEDGLFSMYRRPLCSNCGLIPHRPGQRYCYVCHAQKMREWRRQHPLSREARLKMNARTYCRVAVQRGYLKPGPCVVCGEPHAQAHHADYAKPLEVVWLCREHHLALHGKRFHRKNPRHSK